MKRFAMAAVCCILVSATLSHAIIYNWHTGQVISGTEGITPGPGIDLSEWRTSSHNLRYASLSGLDLNGGNFYLSWLNYARFIGTNLSNAYMSGTNLSSADLTNADVSGTDLGLAYLTGANLTGANLTNAVCASANVSGANLTGANLTNTNLNGATLTATNFTNATVRGADLSYTTSYTIGKGFTKEQLYSTASYKAKDLGGIGLESDDLSAWDLHGQNLSGANLQSGILIGTDLRGANLTDAAVNANLRLADLRGAALTGATGTPIIYDTIWNDGTIAGLQLTSGEELVIRNYSMAITVNDGWTMTGGAALKMVLESNWQSVISTNAAVDLGGELDLAFADGVDIASLIGTEFKLFNWNGRLTAGDHFDSIVFAPGTEWDTSRLYTDGIVTLVPEPLTLAMLGLGGLMVRRKK